MAVSPSERISAILERQGFPVSGCVDYDLARDSYAVHVARFENWLHTKKQGEMAYLERGLDRRRDPTRVFPDLKSVIVVLKPYPPHPVGTEQLRYARYLNGPDYHVAMKESLEAAFHEISDSGLVAPGFRYKVCVDTSAVLERAWAQLTGLGWIGKNTLLIHPQLGSYLFIGVVFTNQSFGAKPKLLPDYCGNCTRCLGACPTQALSPRDLDSRRCISYLTLEKRGPWEEPLPTAGFVAGCDLCQEVCPFNLKPVKGAGPVEVAPFLVCDPVRLQSESEEAYLARIQGTALERVRYSDFKRNLSATLT